ncbi:MAG: hypothetical protein KF795_00600 [Labilithrix sp.]|nr:hypothetical protein [Labilithrix sp.]
MKPRCLAVPLEKAPELKVDVTFIPPVIPGANLNLEFCCKAPPIEIPPIPVPIPPVALTAATPFLKNAVAALNEYLNKLQLKCPLE